MSTSPTRWASYSCAVSRANPDDSPLAAIVKDADAPLQVHVYEDAASLARIEPAWRELICSAGHSEPFMRPEWIRSWWNAFGKAGHLRLVTVWQGERLVGILPLMLNRVRRYGIPLRRLGAPANVHSPRVDCMVSPDVTGVIDAIWRHVAGMEGQWDIFELPRLLSDSPVIRSLSARAETDGFRFGLWQAESSPFINTATEWNRYLSGRSRNFRKELRRKTRQLSQTGRIALEVVVDPVAVPEALETGFEIEADGWKGRAGSAMKSNDDVRRFYHELAGRMAHSGLLRLHFLELDGERIAFDLSIEFGGRLYSLKSGFRDGLSASSPGLVLLGLMLEHYMATELEEIDLLGEQDEFKQRWTSNARSHHWFVCFAPTPRASAVHRIKFGLIPRIKKLGKRLKAVGHTAS
ncbi:GNAT family N-acetyltransferase [Wenzhouxiangella sediminis]|uniref:GNAT family N-acetyltransferase n=1 Tax=Wenzhouxiangella sediminis TaxID=1792836 RepID=A0A3E1KAX6_9GAMM|nr:GNAT family N-acetyltransferase [Wenzhouxiangella sediminis]